jgi:spore protease
MENRRTDLAHEAITGDCKKNNGVKLNSFESNGFKIVSAYIDKSTSKRISYTEGKYVSLYCGKAWIYNNDYQSLISKELSKQLKAFLLPSYKHVLICCIGNNDITADSLGPRVADKLIVNRHLRNLKDDFLLVSMREISLISPGVIGQCGIGIEELSKCVSNLVNADLIVTIDALASKSAENLGTVIQISDVGVRPGSGVGGNRQEISKATTGIPVISIGVPTVIEYSDSYTKEAEKLLVSPKEIDLIIASYSKIIATGINLSLKDF